MIRVAILAHSDVALFELACAAELFALPRPEFENWYQAEVINLESTEVNCTGGVLLHSKTVASLEDYDMLVVPSWPTTKTKIPSIVGEELTRFHQAGKRILSFCSGAFLLAELDILKDRRVTTHWRYERVFREHFPNIEYLDNVLYEFDGTIGCSAGSAAGLDLGLAVIRQDFGYDVANQVAKRLVISAHRQGGQSQFVETPMLEVPNQFSHALEWASKNIEKPIQVDQLAQKANMSRRTFDRKFRSSFDVSPKQWLTQQRIERAKGLLETLDLPIEQLANRAGFENAITMRHHFRHTLGISPNEYRRQFTCNET